ncbi:MAG TPA: hypothetical protein PLK71_01115, partial [Candidatus Paceibacterota bacterium]|nr:hypothetical protein [Candidatus Paceibacterota bacterium]
ILKKTSTTKTRQSISAYVSDYLDETAERHGARRGVSPELSAALRADSPGGVAAATSDRLRAGVDYFTRVEKGEIHAFGFIAGLIVAGVIIAAVVFGLTWLGQPKAVVETPAAAAFKHGFEVKVAAGPWRKVEEVDWAKVKSTFTIPAKGNIHCDQAVNAGKRLHYAIRQPDGVIIEMKPLGEQSPEDKKQEVTAPVGAVVQVTSLTGEELSLLIQY